jgi:UDP-3-O-acyl N-acetylglucosamine deacetylase
MTLMEMANPSKKTIKKEISFSGKALQAGAEVHVICKPAGPNEGIVFKRLDLDNKPTFSLKEGIFTEAHRRSAVGSGPAAVHTVEHFLAALWALEIDNILVEIDNAELPALDGSASEFLRLLKEAGTVDQDATREIIKIIESERIEKGASSIEVAPSEGFSISYLIDYSVPSIGREIFEFDGNKDSFADEIASARTFCLKKEALFLRLLGLGKGANYDNTLIMGSKGPVKTELRFPNEPLRHKILDLVGDLYLLGRPIQGKVTAEKTGHALNLKMIRRIYEKYVDKNN